MDLTHPEYAVLGENRARILYRLAVLAEPASGRRIHELSGVSSLRTTQRILSELVETGIATVRQLGPSNAYSLNREHVLWAPLEQLLAARALTETGIAEILQATLAESAVGTFLYGSFARGEAGTESDIDILVVWNDDLTHEQSTTLLDEAAGRITRLTGNPAQLFPVTIDELDQIVARKDPFAESLRRDARTLTGSSIKTVLEGPHPRVSRR